MTGLHRDYKKINFDYSISWLTIKPEEVTFDYNLQANKSIITNLDLKNKSKTYIAYKVFLLSVMV